MKNRVETDLPEEYQALKMNEARLRTIFESEPECVKTVDRDCNLLDMNPAGLRMIGANSLDEVCGVSLFKLLDPRYHDYYREGVEAVFRGETLQQQFEIESLDGTRRWMDQTAAPLFDPEAPSRVTEMVAVTRDITEQKKTEERLLQAKLDAETASRAKSTFLANMSHEIRTPMNGVLGMLHVLTETDLTETQIQLLNVARESSQSLLKLLNDILDLSKIEAGQVRMEQIPFKLSDQTSKLAELFMVEASDKSLSFEVTCFEGAQLQRIGDPTRLSQILRNLVSNAIKFTKEGRVCVDVRASNEGPDNQNVQITVVDTGIGMSARQIEQIFEPFSQADESTTRRFGGTGLGLAIAKDLVDLMGGSIKVTSTLHEGSRFEIILPFPLASPRLQEDRSASAAADKKVGDQISPVSELDRIRVLAVDDNQINRMILENILASPTTEVIFADNGQTAISLAASNRFDVILMDIQMPDMDGIETLRGIRAIEKSGSLPHTPIVAFTAGVTNDEVDRYTALGFAGCIAKPIEPDGIRATIEGFRRASAHQNQPGISLRR